MTSMRKLMETVTLNEDRYNEISDAVKQLKLLCRNAETRVPQGALENLITVLMREATYDHQAKLLADALLKYKGLNNPLIPVIQLQEIINYLA
jgi:hypothetical protein